MTAPVLLIAEREFRTYVATASFWVALAIVPLAASAALALAETREPPPAVSVRAQDPGFARAAVAAVAEAGRLEGHAFAFVPDGETMELWRQHDRLSVRFAPAFPLSREGRAFVMRTLELESARRAAGKQAPVVNEAISSARPAHAENIALPGFVLMMLLWLTLTGSLGMLLQSVVRERANRALESLLAAASPWAIMVGKLAGVGAVSFCVLAAWLASAGALSVLFHAKTDAAAVLSTLVSPPTLGKAIVVYALGYAFYGSLTVALGAMARDTAAAQNLSRPMFAVLLAAFFVALWSAASGGTALASRLVYAPPFAPFLLLLGTPGTLSFHVQAASLALLTVSAFVAASFAVNRLSIAPREARAFGLKRVPRFRRIRRGASA